MGDFNSITNSKEKVGGSKEVKKKHKKCREFVQRSGLIDLGYGGPAYTWANNQREKKLILERLDRGMATTSWIHLYPNSKILHLPNFQSDHLPVLLTTHHRPKKKQKQFRVEQWWLQDPDFKGICGKAVDGGDGEWSRVCSRLRKEIRGWVEGAKDPSKELKLIEDEMQYLLSLPHEEGVRQRIEKFQGDFTKYIVAQELHWLQRSRQNWALRGDSNTRFFHSSIVIRRRRNSISAILKEDGEWVTKEREVRQQFINHFKSVYLVGTMLEEEGPTTIPQEVINEVRPIPREAWAELDRRPTVEEIKRVVFELGPLKAPGPDGITAALVQQSWDTFGPSVQHEVELFFSNTCMKESIAHSNLVLVPKIAGPTRVTDFRPISVCNLLYKVISKLVAKKMQPWMNF